MSARILVVDDHEVLREGVKSLLAKARPDLAICGEATDGDQAIRFAQELTPDVVILDISMPRMSGLEACTRMKKLGLNIPVLIFTTHDSERLEREVRQAGAQGYVLKSHAARNLIRAIDTILAGGSFFCTPPKPESAGGNKPNPGAVFCRAFALANLIITARSLGQQRVMGPQADLTFRPDLGRGGCALGFSCHCVVTPG
jgi:DNA-binding NarL/FixJ family response regulator